MKKLLNILYVTNPQSYLIKDGENLAVKIEDQIVFRTPIHYLEGIVTFGHPGASPALLGMCVEKRITVSFLSPYGKYLASVSGAPQGNVLLRKKQFRISEEEQSSAEVSSRFIQGKIYNCRTVLRRFLSDYQGSDNSDVSAALSVIERNLRKIPQKLSLEELRGVEGETARSYFSVFERLIVNQKEDFFMKGRSRRPPLDNVNALLSFFYTLLLHETKAALITVGLDPFVGFLHRDRPGRLSLALDLMEEFRPYMVDRLVLTMINRRQISGRDFIQKESGGVILKDSARKEVLEIWQKRKREEITHPFLEEKIQLGLLPYTQALILARHLRGDLETYPPFFWK